MQHSVSAGCTVGVATSLPTYCTPFCRMHCGGGGGGERAEDAAVGRAESASTVHGGSTPLEGVGDGDDDGDTANVLGALHQPGP